MLRKTITILPMTLAVGLALVSAPALAKFERHNATSNFALVSSSTVIDQSSIADGYSDNDAMGPSDDDTVMSNDDGDDSDDALSTDATE